MNFVFFVALNGILLLRPEEMFPEIAGLRLYLTVIVICIITSLRELREFFSLGSLAVNPIAVCVIAYFLSTIISLFALGRTSEALLEFGPEFSKVIIYFSLLVSIINNESRYRLIITWILIFIILLSSIALAQQHNYVSFPNIEPVMQRETDKETGEIYLLPRMVSSGIFNDPNDLCLLLGFGTLCCIHLSTIESGGLAKKILWLAPLPVLLLSVLETQSKGGLLGVLAGISGYVYSRYGGPKTLPYAVIGGASTIFLVGGRQGSIGGGGTAHERLMFWADGLSNLFNQPMHLLTGLGNGWFVKENGLVSHNSFVQTYVEQGLLGGTAFCGAFAYSIWMIDGIGRTINSPDWACKSRPFAFGSICGYAIGCYSLTRNLAIPTYMVIGLATVIVIPRHDAVSKNFQVNLQWLFRTSIIGCLGLIGIKLITQLLCMTGV